MVMEDWSAYVRRVTDGLNQLEVAAKTGLAQTNIGRWMRGEHVVPKAESVVAFARAFNEPPVEALVAAGYLTAEEAGAKARKVRTPLREYTEHELIDELSSRFPD
jgi:transcriptional regulator with XRE-family HTH domain